MRVLTKKLSNFSQEEISQLNKLTLRSSRGDFGGSLMREEILWSSGEPRTRIRVFYIKEGAKIVAWASVFLPEPKKKKVYVAIYTYVMRQFRGNGFGKRLLNAASKFIKSKGYTPRVFAWNIPSFRFFNKCSKKLAINIIKYPEVKEQLQSSRSS